MSATAISRYRRRIVRGCLLLSGLAVLVAFAAPAWAQPTSGRMVDEVRMERDGGTTHARVTFFRPMFYVYQTPYGSSRAFLIRLFPLQTGTGDWGAVSARETIPFPTPAAGLTQMIYEGDMEGGPFLRLQFSLPVTLRVHSSGDFRNLDISITPSALPAPETAK